MRVKAYVKKTGIGSHFSQTLEPEPFNARAVLRLLAEN